jgi:NAD(P)H-hydrate epimerase
MEITAAFVREHLPEIKKEYNKFDRGRLLVIAGSYGMAGACIMAARSALRTGIGYLNVAVPKEIYEILAVSVPEAVFTIYENPEDLSGALLRADAVLLGPGLGTLRDRICPYVFREGRKPLLIDADGLNTLAEAPWDFTGRDVVLTPHEGEMARLLEIPSSAVRRDRRGALLQAVLTFRASVLLKGTETLVADGRDLPPRKGPEEEEEEPAPGPELPVMENHTGNPCLAAAGSGDVLSGIIGALMAGGVPACEAAAMGAWIHGFAGDLAAERFGMRSARPGDVIEEIPEVLKRLEALSE